MVLITNLSKTYITKRVSFEALESINLNFEDIGLISIIGESGSGKTTLLNCISGLDKPTSGEIVGIKPEDCSFIFQDFQLIETLTVKENLSLVANDIKEIQNVLAKVKLEKYIDKKINQLSGGQKQRIAIAGAILLDKKALFADEPTGNLDSKMSEEIFGYLKDLSKTKLVIVVTHNEKLARKFSNRIIELRDGNIVLDEQLENVESNVISDGLIKNHKNKITLKEMFLIKKADKRKDLLTRIFNVIFMSTCFLASVIFLNNYLVNEPKSIAHLSNVTHLPVAKFEHRKTKYYEPLPLSLTDAKAISNKLPGSVISRYNIHFNFYDLNGYNFSSNENIYTADSFNLKMRFGRKPEKQNEIAFSYTSAENFAFNTAGMADKVIKEGLGILIGEHIIIEKQEMEIVGIDHDYLKDDNYSDEYYCYMLENDFDKCFKSKLENDSPNINIAYEQKTSYQHVSFNESYHLLYGNYPSNNNEIVINSVIADYFYGSVENSIGKPIAIQTIFKPGDTCVEEQSLTVVGVSSDNLLHAGNGSFEAVIKGTDYYSNAYYKNMIGLTSKQINEKNIKYLYKNSLYYFGSYSDDFRFGLEYFNYSIKTIVNVVSLPLIVLLALFQFVTARQQIKNNKRIIGILKTLGYKNKQTIKVFILDNIIQVLISLVITIPVAPFIVKLLNDLAIKNGVVRTYYIPFIPLSFLILFVIAIIIPIISLVISYIQLNRKSNVDIVYER